MKRSACWAALIVLTASAAAAQPDAAKIDMIRMTNEITKRVGVLVLATVRPREAVHDIEVRFGGPVKEPYSAMGAVIAVVAETTRNATYKTEWCYIVTREFGRERILVTDLHQVEALARAAKGEEAWAHFQSKKTVVK